MSILVGLDIASQGLLASQLANQTASQNISNASTPGYSRQRVALSAQVGGGVTFDAQRVRDSFLDFQYRVANQAAGSSDYTSSAMDSVQSVLNEPGPSGLQSALDAFWNSWSDLANQPSSSAARSALVAAGNTLASSAQRLSQSFSALQTQADGSVQQDVTQINQLATQIAGLNSQIVAQPAGGSGISDLQDQRDLAIDSLSKLVNVQVNQNPSGAIDIYAGGHFLVSGSTSAALQAVPNGANHNFVDVSFVDGAPSNLSGGSLGAALQQRDGTLAGYASDLNTLITGVMNDVNTAHASGYGLDGVTNRPFFTGTGASNIAVNAAVAANPDEIAASSTLAGIPGDGSNASAIAGIRDLGQLNGGLSTYDEFYGNLVSSIGSATQAAHASQTSQDAMVAQVDQLRQSTSGVNLDQEMVQLMQFQRAYQAAAQVINVSNTMLNSLFSILPGQ